MKHQFLIASYKKDFEWLAPCLRSLDRWSTLDSKPVVAVSAADFSEAVDLFSASAEVKAFDGANGKTTGFARAQEAMLSGDILCPGAQYVWVLGSDCILTKPLDIDTFFRNGKPVMQYVAYENAGEARFWQLGSTRALGWQPAFECMRRLPLIYTPELYRKTRDLVSKFTMSDFSEYLQYAISELKDFSESNTLGAVAHRYLWDRYTWERTDLGTPYTQTEFIQFWSHGGLDRPCSDIQYILPDGRTIRDLTPRQVMESLDLL